MTRDAVPAPEQDPLEAFVQPEGWRDSALQDALRGLPRPEEDWQTQDLVEVVLARAQAAGFRSAASEPDPERRQMVVISDRRASVFVGAPVHPSQVRRWRESESFEHARGVDPMDFQRDLLDEVIHGLKHRNGVASRVADVLGEPLKGAWPQSHRVDAALRVWWEARLEEGHTRESARVMLGLTVHPSVLSCVVYDLAGDPFVWVGGSR